LTPFFDFYNIFFRMGENNFKRNLGRIIFRLRKKRKLTQEELCLLCDINRSYLFKIEKGIANPSIKVLNKICRVLKIKMCDLLGEI
jgi:transcriptional regulator with XRE-family HTH domain